MRHAKLKQLQKQRLKSKVVGCVAVAPADACGPQGDLLGAVAQYYSKKVQTYGATPHGADWSCLPTQEMRFVQLLKVCKFDAPIRLNDIGCGYGALRTFLGKRYRHKVIDYLGIDISAAMIARAQQRWKNRANTAFEIASGGFRAADYSVASGVFNVKLDLPDAQWERVIRLTLQEMHASSRRGFAVNFLTPVPGCAPQLYCAPPDVWVGYCERTFQADVALIANYGMREYTLLVHHNSNDAG